MKITLFPAFLLAMSAPAFAQTVMPVFSANFNAEQPGLLLRNGAALGDDGSGISGLAGDRAYVSGAIDAAQKGPVAQIAERVNVEGLEELTFTGWYKAAAIQAKDATILNAGGLTIIGDRVGEWTVRVDAPSGGKMYWFYSGKKAPGEAWVPQNEWRFFAFTWNKAKNEGVFYGATPQSEVAETSRTTQKIVAEGPLKGRLAGDKTAETLGNSSRSQADRPFNGALDNFRIFPRSLPVETLEKIRAGDLQNADAKLELK